VAEMRKFLKMLAFTFYKEIDLEIGMKRDFQGILDIAESMATRYNRGGYKLTAQNCAHFAKVGSP